MGQANPLPLVSLSGAEISQRPTSSGCSDGLAGILAGLSGWQPPSEQAGHHGRIGEYTTLLESLDVAVCAVDALGRLTFYNKAAARLWGWRPALYDQAWCGCWRLFSPDGTPLPYDGYPTAICLRRRRPVRGRRSFAERPDGTRVPIESSVTPLLDADGALVGAVNVLVDVSGLQSAEERLQECESRFHTAQDLSAQVENSVQNFPDSGGKQRPIVSTLVHAIIRLFGRSFWGVAHGLDCRDPAPSFGKQGEHQFDRA